MDDIDHTKTKPINVLRYEVFFNLLSVQYKDLSDTKKRGNQFWWLDSHEDSKDQLSPESQEVSGIK